MIVYDNYLRGGDFNEILDLVSTDEFIEIGGEDKKFLAIITPEEIKELVEIPGHETVFSFIRKAHKDFDTDPRIHADGIILNENVDVASVLYITTSGTTNGTAFYSHRHYGQHMPADISEEEFNRLLIEDSNDPSKWEMVELVLNRPNRLLVYDAKAFHSKHPPVIENGERVVMATFYKSTDQ